MKLNVMKLGLLLLVSLITINTASANPGYNVAVTPISSTVSPGGGTTTYSVTLSTMDTLDIEEFAELSVIDLNGNPISWDTTFSENTFLIGPHPVEKTVNLEVKVPEGTPVGEYHLKVKGDGYLPDFNDPNIPDKYLGSMESSDFPITVSVTQIPEFPSVAVPVVAVLGLVAIIGRRKE